MSAPEGLKALVPYFKVADEFRQRDPIVSYYVVMYAVQRGIKMPASKERAEKLFLVQKMSELESLKAGLAAREEVAEETVGQAHLETVAIKLFSWADEQDRSGSFGKPVIKAFYSASSLFETLRQFGELSLEVEEKMRYSKVKAVYLSTCLKTGETPVPGNPLNDSAPPPLPLPLPQSPQGVPEPAAAPEEQVVSSSGAPIAPELLMRAEEHVRFAGSALQYQDVGTAVSFLQRALSILSVGQDLAN